MKPKTRARIRALFAMMGSPNEQEAATAKRKLEALLKQIGKTWNDLLELLKADDEAPQPAADPRDAADLSSHPYDRFVPASTVYGILEKYVAIEPHEYIAVALWVIHTHIFDQFMVTPRLLLTSPVRNCGKTTLLDVVGRLVARPERHDSTTAASIYHITHKARRTLLLDEADNLEMSAQATLRAVLNSGYRKGGAITRVIGGEAKRFTVFTPIALAAIGSLTLPLMSRSIVIHMRRHENVQLRRFDLNNVEDLDLVYGHVRHWVSSVTLNSDPPMPRELQGRVADNWRPLIAIADACGGGWPAHARQAAIAFTRADRDEDTGITLLNHIRDIFDALSVDRIASRELVQQLIGLDSADGIWREPRKLTQRHLAVLLRPFGIQPRQLWPLPRTANSRSYRGYQRVDFEAAWTAYCSNRSPPSQPIKIAVLQTDHQRAS